MFVIAHHFIQQPEEFWAAAQQGSASLPSHLKIHSVFPSRDMRTGTCVWEAASVNDVQSYLDEKMSSMAKNVCYEVNDTMALGLPQKTMEAAATAG
ncbi:hypothetical protein [Flavisolibacter tropicus]|uniref:DUF4242 domain-containing protein n=1 Tax=Flavisolibacter tropicus TaxID=1492898 RepID=A0A172TV88_9BACT|nr:hypothetical protein [Flavisolibacter tropicus]ANE50995.1 hypothetical protein SY85_11260 [Flavisolibacter tropicus]